MIIYLVNGMPRSASTWLYNAVRYIVTSNVDLSEFVYGWCDDVDTYKRYNLLKSHHFNQSLIDSATYLFYSYRDIRDVLASRMRMWNHTPSLEYARSLIHEVEYFKNRADYTMVYEDFLRNQKLVIQKLSDILSMPVDIENIYLQLNSAKKPASDGKPYNNEDLYHKGHVTSGAHMDFDCVPRKLIIEIESEFDYWFKENNYPLTTR